jgi:hypothetical protein
MYTKKPEGNEKDLVFVQSQELNEKCGKCGGQLVIKIFWSKNGYQQKIECLSCGMGGWKKEMTKKD